jgi:hypothetical protein
MFHYFKCESCLPFFVSLLFLFSYGASMVVSIISITSIPLAVFAGIESTVVTVLFIWTFMTASCADPGYLPFDWARTRRTKYAWDELMGGSAINTEQFDYVKAVDRPPSCSFSHYVGRYVIRGDHICGWIGNWVAKRNHKHFILSLFWGGIASGSFIIWKFVPRTPLFEGTAIKTFELATLVINIAVGSVMLLSGLSFLMEACSSQTRIQKFKNAEIAEVSRMEAMKQICGNHHVCCWICPIDAFGDEIILEEFSGERFATLH